MRRSPLLLLIAFTVAACAGPFSFSRSRNLNPTEKMMWSTYLVATKKGMATAFVIAHRDPSAPDGIVPIVVTSAHVLETIGNGLLAIGIRIPDAEGKPQVVALQIEARRSGARFYVRHPRHDIGALELKIPREIAGLIRLPSFLDERALAGGAELRAGNEVLFLGFPDVIPPTPGAFPVLRSGRIASNPSITMLGQQKFLINADVYPGDSGAPVFAFGRGKRPELLGMIVQRIGRDTRAFAHFAVAVDASAILETVQLVTEREGSAPVASKMKQRVTVPR